MTCCSSGWWNMRRVTTVPSRLKRLCFYGWAAFEDYQQGPIWKLQNDFSCFMSTFSQCSAEYASDNPSKPESSEAWTHLTARSLSTWGTLGRMDLSSCPCFPRRILSAWLCESGSPFLWQWCWGCLQMPSAFKLVMSGTFQKGLCSHLESQQEQMGGRSTLFGFLLRNLISPPEFPRGTWLLPLQGGTGWGSWSPPELGALKLKKASLAEGSAVPNMARLFLSLVFFSGWFFGDFFFKGILRLTENQGLSVPCWANPGGIEKAFGNHFHVVKSIR